MPLRSIIRGWFGRKQPDGVQWAKLWIPDAATTKHFLAAGATGAGKTTLLRLLLRSVAPDVADTNRDTRIVLYDPKAQWTTELVDLGLGPFTRLLNPFDARSVAWDMAADITTEPDAGSVASILIPEGLGGGNQFFYDAARKLVKAVVYAFVELYRREVDGRRWWTLNRPWDLRDVLLATSNVDDLAAIIEHADLPTDSLEDYLSAEKEAKSVRMTVSVQNENYNAIAAAWHHATRRVSFDGWVSDRTIWLLGASKRYRTALATINRLILSRLQQSVLEVPKKFRKDRRHWFFLDEFPSLGRLPYFEELLTEGREWGAAVVLGFQHIAHMQEVYGERVVEAMADNCHHYAFFRANGPTMAKWCSERFPPLVEYDEESPLHIKRQSPSVQVLDLMELPSADEKKGFTCILKSENDIIDGPQQVNVSPRDVPPKPAEVVEGDNVRARFVPRNKTQLEMTHWSEDERAGLRLQAKPVKARGVTLPAVPLGHLFSSNDDFPSTFE